MSDQGEGEGGGAAGGGGGALVPVGPVRDVGPRREGGIRLEAYQVDAVATQYLRWGDARMAVVRAGVREFRWPFDVVVERVMGLPEVVARIEELRAAGVVGGEGVPGMTREEAGARLEGLLQDAERAGEIDAAVRVLGLYGKWQGWEKHEMTVTHRRAVEELTDAELEEMVRKRLRETSVEPDGEGGR